jgi:hypothetical protein
MDFKDQIKQLVDRVAKLKDQVNTEEATKNAFIMPFIQMLGYDIFNPLEVVPEFVADIGIKKGEKVDYAIIKDNEPIILIECKHWAQKLDIHDNQLLRYFNVTKAKFAILTNGFRYKFYTDLVESNRMDEKPFLEFDISEMKDIQIEELKKFHKSYFDIEKIISSASELKYTNEIKTILVSELKSPSEDFIRYFTQRVYPRKITQNVLLQFSDLVRKSIQQVLSDMITHVLKSAIDKENEASKHKEEEVPGASEENDNVKERVIQTTEEEMEAFFIIKSILRTEVEPNRIGYRDALTYFVVLLDDNNRRTICRLYFNTSKKYIGIFDSNRKEVKYDIRTLDDIYNLSDLLKLTAQSYLALN